MKICFYRHSLLSRGGDKMVVEYANYLHARGENVTILTSRTDTVFPVNVPIRPISHQSYKLTTLIKALMKKYDYDIIVADIIILVLSLAFRNIKTLIYFAQDYDESYYRNPISKVLIRTAYFYCLKVRKIPVIAVSEELGQLLKEKFNARVIVVKNGVDTAVFFPEKNNEYLPMKRGKKIILVFARSDYRKGFDIAVNVLSEFSSAIEKGDLAIWAVGEWINVPFRMKNFGFVSPEQLRKILSCSDVLLYPSRHEGLPLFVLEALSCGCPVVTTEAVHFLNNMENALVCKMEDVACLKESLGSILANAHLQSRLTKAGLNVAMAYSLSESKKQFHKAISLAVADQTFLDSAE